MTRVTPCVNDGLSAVARAVQPPTRLAESLMWERRPRSCAAMFAAVVAFTPAAARAQAVLGLGEDATTPPHGVVRADVSNTWLRYRDLRIGIGGEEVSLPSLVRPTLGTVELGL